eukprot:943881-Amorphochlora_amoeboformis.AAC.1
MGGKDQLRMGSGCLDPSATAQFDDFCLSRRRPLFLKPDTCLGIQRKIYFLAEDSASLSGEIMESPPTHKDVKVGDVVTVSGLTENKYAQAFSHI